MLKIAESTASATSEVNALRETVFIRNQEEKFYVTFAEFLFFFSFFQDYYFFTIYFHPSAQKMYV